MNLPSKKGKGKESNNKDSKILRTPIAMYFCEKLIVKAFKANQLNYLLEAQRYFTKLQYFKKESSLPNKTSKKSKIEKNRDIVVSRIQDRFGSKVVNKN